MLHRSLLAKLLTPALLAAIGVVSGAGCGGCDDPSLTCDANGENCVYCDAYGCQDVDPGTTTGGQGGAGGAGGSSGQGGQGGQGGGACDPTVAVCPCDADGACPGDLICADGLCVEGCDFSYECGPGKLCANGQCVPACSDPAECGPGATCENGICVPDPTNPECSDQAPCPGATEICVDGQCATACDDNADCPTGEVCNAGTGACMPDPSPQASCGASGAQCGGQLQVCMADGYCHYPCQTTQECKLIDNRFESCDQGICKTVEELNPECTTQMPCPPGLDCINNHCL